MYLTTKHVIILIKSISLEWYTNALYIKVGLISDLPIKTAQILDYKLY